MKTLIRALIALVILAAGFLLGAGWERSRAFPAPAPALVSEEAALPKETAASVLIDTGSELLGFANLGAGEGATVMSLLDAVIARNPEVAIATESYGDIGTLVTEINGYKNGTDGNYWQFWVNNEYAEVAADTYPVAAGDSVMWKFTSARFTEY